LYSIRGAQVYFSNRGCCSSNPRCILGSIFVNIAAKASAANNKMAPIPLYKINVIVHEAEISNRYCFIADVIVNV